MTPFAWLLGLVLPACGMSGAAGLPPPQPVDMARLVRPASPNTALAAPADFLPAPDIATGDYPVPPAALLAAVKAMAATRPRTFLLADYPERLQAQYVARSLVFNFPDVIVVQVLPAAPASSRLLLYSRSIYGYSDLGANRARVRDWLDALQTTLPQPRER